MSTDAINALAQSALESIGYDVIQISSTENRHIRGIVDHDPPGQSIGIEDLVRATREIERALEAGGFDPDGFDIQMNSPGMDRLLTRPKDFERFKGHVARLTLRQKIGNRRSLTGALLGFSDERVQLASDGGEDQQSLELANIKEARLVPSLPKPPERRRKTSGRHKRGSGRHRKR